MLSLQHLGQSINRQNDSHGHQTEDRKAPLGSDGAPEALQVVRN